MKKIKITGAKYSSYWYSNCIGQEFKVESEEIRSDGLNYYVEKQGACAVLATDCEVVEAPVRFYVKDGITYELPVWAKYVTRDGSGARVIAWEEEPTNKGTSKAGVNFQEEGGGRRTTLYEYTQPLPVGAFKEEV